MPPRSVARAISRGTSAGCQNFELVGIAMRLLILALCVVVAIGSEDALGAGVTPAAGHVTPQSPRLAGLLAALDRNDQSALDAFWKDIETEHTPLVEDIPNQPHEALFTF